MHSRNIKKTRDALSVTEAVLQKNLFGKKSYSEAAIVELAGKAVGFAFFFHNFSTFLGKQSIHFEDLYVNEAGRDYGVGKRIIQPLKMTVDT